MRPLHHHRHHRLPRYRPGSGLDGFPAFAAGPALALLPALLPALLLAGCGGGSPAKTADQDPPVPVTAVAAETRTIPDIRHYPGNTQAIRQAMVVARIEGYLEQRLFEEGTDVDTGDLLFIIEQPPYEAAVLAARGALAEARAQRAYAFIEFERNEPLVVSGAISASDWDLIVANLEVADAAVAVAEANLVQAEIDFSYTEVRAPYPGRMGQRFVDVGNLVGPGDHENLAELVVMDPMRVVFEPAATETADFLEAWQGGRREVPVTVEFTSTDTTPKGRRSVTLQGTLDLVNNTADTGTSTFLARAQFPNPGGTVLPGTYASVSVTVGSLGSCVVVPDQAIYRDPQYQYVWKVDGDVIKRMNVTTGPLYQGLRVVSGLKAGTAVVAAAQPLKLREGTKVTARTETIDAWTAARAKETRATEQATGDDAKGAGTGG